MCGGYRALLPRRPRHFPTPIHLLKPGEGQSGGRKREREREGEREVPLSVILSFVELEDPRDLNCTSWLGQKLQLRLKTRPVCPRALAGLGDVPCPIDLPGSSNDFLGLNRDLRQGTGRRLSFMVRCPHAFLTPKKCYRRPPDCFGWYSVKAWRTI